MNKLKKCPFCGSENVIKFYHTTGCEVYCHTCKAGVEKDFWADAVALWNQRSKEEDLERQLKERNRAHIELHQDYNKKYNECKDLERQLEGHKKLVSLMVELKAEKDKLGKLTISLEIDELVEQLKEKDDE